MDTHNDALCIHCNAELTPRDLADGWCDTCGKRLPSGPRSAPTPKPAVPVTPPGSAKKWPLILGGVVMALLGVAAAFAAAG